MEVRRLGNLKRKIKNDVVRIAYVEKNERGLEEYVLVFENSVPKPLEEPHLYRDAEIEIHEKGESILTYPELNTQVVLITLKRDEEFREEHPEIIEKIEVFRMDEIRKNGEKIIDLYTCDEKRESSEVGRC